MTNRAEIDALNRAPAFETASQRQTRANRAADLALRAAHRRGQIERVEATVAGWQATLPPPAEWTDVHQRLAECAYDILEALNPEADEGQEVGGIRDLTEQTNAMRGQVRAVLASVRELEAGDE